MMRHRIHEVPAKSRLQSFSKTCALNGNSSLKRRRKFHALLPKPIRTFLPCLLLAIVAIMDCRYITKRIHAYLYPSCMPKTPSPVPNRRKFLKYTSSTWEKTWLKNIAKWEKEQTVCENLLQQQSELREFMKATCTAFLNDTDWCYQDDSFQPFWWNVKTMEAVEEVPMELRDRLFGEDWKERYEVKYEYEDANSYYQAQYNGEDYLYNGEEQYPYNGEEGGDTNSYLEYGGEEAMERRRRRMQEIIDFTDNYSDGDYNATNATNYRVDPNWFGNAWNTWWEPTYKFPKLNFTASPIKPRNLPEDKHGSPFVFSKFEFLDELTGETYVEYIEPLVSHLRHPLARCQNADLFLLKRSYLLPPPEITRAPRKFYFDAGASSWSSGAGGPSLSYFTTVWKRHGIEFDRIMAWEGTVAPIDFQLTVPEEYEDRVRYFQKWISSSPREHNDATPFLPFYITGIADKEDYVLFKLDIDSGDVEKGTIDHLLSTCNDHIEYIDELLWEHHVEGNYLLTWNWLGSTEKGSTMKDSYKMFLELRRRGVRAHSWV